MKKLQIALTGIAAVMMISGVALAQSTPSAKFAATWSTEPALASVAEIVDATVDTVKLDSKTGYTLATIKVPQDKELMVGVSAEIGLVTYGAVKGKNGGTATSIADSEAYVNVFAVPRDGGLPIQLEPGQVMLSKRVQQLDATLGGVIDSCTDTNLDGTIDVETECIVTDEMIGLLQDTTAAHHFNFLLPDANQGIYDIKAVFTTGARAEVDICEDCSGTVSASATAKAVVNKTMLTVQQVRAAKDTLYEVEIVE
jgi:hypothetical protein